MKLWSGLWRRIVMWLDTDVSEDHAASISTSPCRWKQHGPLKRRRPTTTLHGVTTQKTSSEDVGKMDLWNVGILPHHYTVSQPTRLQVKMEAAWTSNVGILPQNHAASQLGNLPLQKPLYCGLNRCLCHCSPTQCLKRCQ
jgi:hypothetical protein